MNDFDVIVIGSGFGGSVSALRLAEKGYRVLVLEKGKRWATTDFPETNWDLRKWMWMPQVGLRGFFQMSFLKHVTVLHGVGVGGGSLVYANTLPIPKHEFFGASSWANLADWKRELDPHYATASACSAPRRTHASSAATRCCARSPATSAARTSFTRPTSASTSASRACACPIRISAARGRTAPAASSVARA